MHWLSQRTADDSVIAELPGVSPVMDFAEKPKRRRNQRMDVDLAGAAEDDAVGIISRPSLPP